MPSAISLFSGMGGDSLGLKNAGWNVIAFNEFWLPAVDTHQLNLAGEYIEGSIRDVPDPVFQKYTGKVNLVFAGFPCQGFSHAGKKNANDSRNELVYEFVRAVRIIQPKYIIGENVTGLLSRKSPEGTPVIDIIRKLFADIGYTIQHYVVNSADVGVPQSRKRLLIVGSKDTLPNIVLPKQPHVGFRNMLLPTLEGALLVADFPEGTKAIDTTEKPTGKPHPWLVKSVEEGLVSAGKRISPHHVEIVDPDVPCKTIICTYERQPRLFVALINGKNKYLRMLVPDELKQIQGFPSSYLVCGSVKEQIIQIGNAVSPPVAQMIASQLTPA
jgi:DNA (cytosine-5)-methyltransferase 1